MGVDPKKVVVKNPKIHDPGRVFYRVAVIDAINRAHLDELTDLIAGLKGLKSEYGGLDGTIKAAEAALGKARGA